jgi:glycosyltransferase involved in cell wall biosynthesis
MKPFRAGKSRYNNRCEDLGSKTRPDMADAPLISVVLPTYNRLATLPRAIDSVRTQTEPNFELIVVDDNSTDGTAEFLASLADPRIHSIGPDQIFGDRQRSQLGVSTARNLGLTAARADIVAFLDSDDIYRPGRLAAPLAAFAADPNLVCALSSASRQVRDRVQDSHMPSLTLPQPIFHWAVICDLFPVEATGLTVRRQDALEIGGFCRTLSLTEDREFLVRLAGRGAVRLLPDVLWEKSWSADGLSMNWSLAGEGLLAYLKQRPEYRTHYPKIASYLATKVLVADIRDHLWQALWRDLRAFGAAGLLADGPFKLWRDHREVRAYRRRMSKPESLAMLAQAPTEWR